MKIGIIGLGYVGLPLLIEFSKKYDVIGYDNNKKRLSDLKHKKDINNELNNTQFSILNKIKKTNKISFLADCNIYIITVPTPVYKNNKPNLNPLKNACLKISNMIKKNDVVIFESTVFPGLTEEYCVNWINSKNNLIYNKEFFCGYSPERINPGDKTKTLTKIIKITSGSNSKTANKVDQLYKSIIKAGTYKAPSIKIAEAAKVIENCQRDINIAFVNELNNVFNKMNLDTNEILNAANSKWNFLNFKPGLVGGHCVGVDPYYLIDRSKKFNYKPEILISARKINESIPKKICQNINKILNRKFNSKIIIFGFSFKENCNDIRNTKIYNIYKILNQKYSLVDVHDPIVNFDDVYKTYNLKIKKKLNKNFYDLALIVVKHDEFTKYRKNKIKNCLKAPKLIYDYINLFK